MNVIDTCLWIEYFLGKDIDVSISNAIRDTSNLLVPTICIYEVYRKALPEKGGAFADVLVEIMEKGNVVDINSDLAVLAAKISKQYKLPMADSIIYATAQMNNATVWTQDKHFQNLEAVNYFPKK
ncbi:MAG: type II toxin-antitoxin system VapC family toxin [Chitinivibrionia bacterium]|nr:type II toxin-antitoxin system VapC family toxin [Chitinivibrionia bacterium]